MELKLEQCNLKNGIKCLFYFPPLAIFILMNQSEFRYNARHPQPSVSDTEKNFLNRKHEIMIVNW